MVPVADVSPSIRGCLKTTSIRSAHNVLPGNTIGTPLQLLAEKPSGLAPKHAVLIMDRDPPTPFRAVLRRRMDRASLHDNIPTLTSLQLLKAVKYLY